MLAFSLEKTLEMIDRFQKIVADYFSVIWLMKQQIVLAPLLCILELKQLVNLSFDQQIICILLW